MKLNILVTGGAGYLGSILAPKLLASGHKVAVLDNFTYLQGESLAVCCADDNFSVVRGDVRDPSVVKPLLKKADVVIPLAALVGAPLCDRDTTAARTVNFEAVKLIADSVSPAQRIIYPTTNSGYGIGADKFCTEDTPLNPISLYGVVKMNAEKAVLARENSISFRLATVFGMSPRMRLDLLVNDFVYRAFTDRFVVIFEGHFRRNYIHIRDVAAAFLHALENFEKMKGQSYNVGLSEANLSKLELCAKIKKHLPAFVYLESAVGEDVDKRDYIVSNEKIERTGFRPAHSLDDGIKELIKGYAMLRDTRYGNV